MCTCASAQKCLYLPPSSHEHPTSTAHVRLSTELRKNEIAHSLGASIVSSGKKQCVKAQECILSASTHAYY